MPKPYPKEFRDDVVAVARKAQGPLNQIAKDFGISEGCVLHNWMKKADVEDGHRPDVTDADPCRAARAQEAQQVAGAGERGPRRATAYLSQANLPGK